MIIGIEIGGTKLQLAVGTQGTSRELLRIVRLPIDRPAGAVGILQQIEQGLPPLLQEYPVTAIGIGFGGPVMCDQGRTITSHQVAGWQDFPLAAWCRQRWNLPVAMDNDCNVAALAEAKLGAGQGSRRVLYVTVGTGIGGGWVVDGHIDGQSRPAVAEIGHLRPGLAATAASATVESLASGLGMERVAADALQHADRFDCTPSDAKELAAQLDYPRQPITTQRLAEAAAAGQPLAAAILRNATQVLGWALAQATTLLAPETIVLGGGVTLLGETFLHPIRDAWRTYVFPPLADCCRIVPAALGEEVVLHGALELARSFGERDAT